MDDKKADLYKCGKELFGLKGFKDTNVSDITKMAGLAVGTFYNYYSSKEKLFITIFSDENVILKEQMLAALDLQDPPAKLIRELLSLNMRGMAANPILKQWYDRDVFQKIEQKYREENGIDKFDFLYSVFFDLINRWQDEGKIRKDIDAELIMTFFAALINLDMHKEEIGLKHFPEILDYLSEFIMKGLTDNLK